MSGNGTAKADPVLEAVGVPAAEIIARCIELRESQDIRESPFRRLPKPVATTTIRQRASWRLVDFRDASDVEFVQMAYLAILCRRPYDTEAARRVAELTAGRARMWLLIRLAFSPEGLRGPQARVSGLFLPALVGAGQAFGLVAGRPAVRTFLLRTARLLRRGTNSATTLARNVWRAIRGTRVQSGMRKTSIMPPRPSPLRREETALHREVEPSRQEERS